MIQAGRPGAGVAGASPRPSKPEPRSIGTDEAGGDGAVLLPRVLSPLRQHDGDRTTAFGEHLFAVPVGALWS